MAHYRETPCKFYLAFGECRKGRNACSQEVRKAFYSLIHERRVGDYHLPEGSLVVGAGNRMQDSAIVKTMSSAILNRMFHVQMKADAGQWIKWAQEVGLHQWVIDYIIQRPDHLFSEPPKTEEPFSTPRSWHMLSDALTEYGAGRRELSSEYIENARLHLSNPFPRRNVSGVHKESEKQPHAGGHHRPESKMAREAGGSRRPVFPRPVLPREADCGAPEKQAGHFRQYALLRVPRERHDP